MLQARPKLHFAKETLMSIGSNELQAVHGGLDKVDTAILITGALTSEATGPIAATIIIYTRHR